jgi:hypothetical protein
MPLLELRSNDYYTFTQKLRETGDDPYLKHKAIKDRQKVRELLTALMKDREVIISYLEDNTEKTIIGTLKKLLEKEYWPELEPIPKSLVSINNAIVPQEHHIAFWEFPAKEARLIHIDAITKFVTKIDGIDAAWFQKVKNENR